MEPCPGCGSKNIMYNNRGYYFCDRCGWCSPLVLPTDTHPKMDSDAVKRRATWKWNARVVNESRVLDPRERK